MPLLERLANAWRALDWEGAWFELRYVPEAAPVGDLYTYVEGDFDNVLVRICSEWTPETGALAPPWIGKTGTAPDE